MADEHGLRPTSPTDQSGIPPSTASWSTRAAACGNSTGPDFVVSIPRHGRTAQESSASLRRHPATANRRRLRREPSTNSNSLGDGHRRQTKLQDKGKSRQQCCLVCKYHRHGGLHLVHVRLGRSDPTYQVKLDPARRNKHAQNLQAALTARGNCADKATCFITGTDPNPALTGVTVGPTIRGSIGISDPHDGIAEARHIEQQHKGASGI